MSLWVLLHFERLSPIGEHSKASTDMSKYNIHDKENRQSDYRRVVSSLMLERLKEQMLMVVGVQKKYRDKGYTAIRMAEDLNTSPRYISVVVNLCFGKNYTRFINGYRIEEAKTILADPAAARLNMTDVSRMVGFGNRQSFYASFFRETGMTPREYRKSCLPAPSEE